MYCLANVGSCRPGQPGELVITAFTAMKQALPIADYLADRQKRKVTKVTEYRADAREARTGEKGYHFVRSMRSRAVQHRARAAELQHPTASSRKLQPIATAQLHHPSSYSLLQQNNCDSPIVTSQQLQPSGKTRLRQPACDAPSPGPRSDEGG